MVTDKRKTRYVYFLYFVSENSIKCDLENYVDFRYTCSFQRKVLPNLTCVVIY